MITIVLPVSRDSFLKQIFQRLAILECNLEEVSLFVYVDGDLQLFEIAQQFVCDSRFIKKEIKYRRKGLPNVSHMLSRRKRIGDIHLEIGQLIDSEYVFLLEDDTLIEFDALEKLIKLSQRYPDAGFVSGVQIGRWGYDHIGAWLYMKDRIVSIPNSDGVVEVTAAGFFCMLMKTSIYRNGSFIPFEKILGPDFTFGLYLSNTGYKNYVDFSVPCKHLTKRGSIDFSNTKVVQVGFIKDDQNQWLLQGEL